MALIFGAYIVVTSLSMVVAPRPFLRLLGLTATGVAWVRLSALLGVVIGSYYLFAARSDDRSFFRATVVVRPVFFVALVVLATAKLIPFVLTGFGVADLFGALWMLWALRTSGAAQRLSS